MGKTSTLKCLLGGKPENVPAYSAASALSVTDVTKQINLP